MTSLLARLKRLGRAERALLIEAIVLLAVAAALRCLPFWRLTTLVRSPSGEAPANDEILTQIDGVRRAIERAAPQLPWRAKCLEQGFAAHWMLRRRSIRSVIYYGVAKGQNGLIAHVWVRSGERDVIGCQNAGQFTQVAQFPAS